MSREPPSGPIASSNVIRRKPRPRSHDLERSGSSGLSWVGAAPVTSETVHEMIQGDSRGPGEVSVTTPCPVRPGAGCPRWAGPQIEGDRVGDPKILREGQTVSFEDSRPLGVAQLGQRPVNRSPAFGRAACVPGGWKPQVKELTETQLQSGVCHGARPSSGTSHPESDWRSSSGMRARRAAG